MLRVRIEFVVLLLLPTLTQAQPDVLRNSVVKIHATIRVQDPFRPWRKGEPRPTVASGAVIEGNRIITCAHVAAFAEEILVESETLRRKVPAKVEHIGRDVDLAILTVEDEAFFEMHTPVDIPPMLPRGGDRVVVYGFPQGGQTLSRTEGVVSRIEYARLYLGTRGYRIQIDAAINPGNSGGPAFVNDELAGIVFSHLREAENIGYLVSSKELLLFLEDVSDGRYDGKPWLPKVIADAEHAAFRDMIGLDMATTGAAVVEPVPWDPDYPLHRYDIITHIGDHDIDDQGMIRLEGGQFVHFHALVQELATDGAVPVTVWRDERTLQIDAPVMVGDRLVIPYENGHDEQDYIIYGPLVFAPLGGMLADALIDRESFRRTLLLSHSPLITRRFDRQAFDGEQLVAIVSPPFTHPVAVGMPSGFGGQIVESVNGIKVRNFEHFVELLRDNDQPYVVFDMAEERMGVRVVNAVDVETVTREVLLNNGIREQMSSAARRIWDADE